MVTEEEQVQEKISNIWKTTDVFLASHNNSLLLFDFTTVSIYENGEIKIKSLYQYKIKDYPNLLQDFLKSGYSIQSSSEDPHIFSVENYIEPQVLSDIVKDKYDPKTVSTTKIVDLKEWDKFVGNSNIAGSAWTLFQHYKNDLYPINTNEQIEVGVYILLLRPLPQKGSKEYSEINNFLSLEVYKFLWLYGREYFTNEYIKKDNDLQRIKIQRNQQRTINHYLRPIFTGISQNAENILKQIEGGKTEEAKLAAKVLHLQAAILEHHFKFGQLLDDIAEETQFETFIIGFERFFEYLYIRNFFTGSHIDTSAIRLLTDEEYNLIKEICTKSLQEFFESPNNFDTTVNTLFSKLSGASTFKLHFRGQTSKMYFELPKNLTSMNVVIKFSSAFIENFKKFWIKDDYFSKELNRVVNSFLIIYSNANEIFFFQNKENKGWIKHSINLTENNSEENDTSIVNVYMDGFKEYIAKSGLGNNDLKSLLRSNEIDCSSYKKDVEVLKDEDGESKLERGSYLYFKKLTLNNNSTLIKK
jgi:hypothetical protein